MKPGTLVFNSAADQLRILLTYSPNFGRQVLALEPGGDLLSFPTRVPSWYRVLHTPD